MKKGYTYTIIFIMAVSVVFSGLLAGVNAAFKNKIAKNEVTAEKASILYSFGIDTAGADINEIFNDRVVEKNLNDMTYYSIVGTSGEIINSIPFEGPGLWGTIKGYISIDIEADSIHGLAFIEQNETPGLGGRIDEDWFKEQFRGTGLDSSIVYGGDSGLDAITGATSTSNAILKIINTFIDTTLKELEEADEK